MYKHFINCTTSAQCNLSSPTSKPSLNCLITTNQVGLGTASTIHRKCPMTTFILDDVTNDISIDASASFNTINTSNLANVSMVANNNNNQALTSPSMYFKTFFNFDNKNSYSAPVDQDSKPKEVPIATPVSSMQHQYISNTIYQPPFYNTSTLNQPVLQSQSTPYSSYAAGPIAQSQSNSYSSYSTDPFDQSQINNTSSQS
ncbi:unnamed protein product [Rotaria socialis]